LWQLAHACVACRPTSAKVLAWLNPPPLQLVSVARWHVSQVVAIPDAAWFGLVVRW